LFIDACEYSGEKGVDYTKRFIKICKRIDNPKNLKAFSKPSIIRITDYLSEKRVKLKLK